MAKRRRPALKAANRRILAAAFLSFGLLGAAAAFAIGYAGALRLGAADPQAAANIRIAMLQRLDASLGYEGYLRAYRAFLETSDSNAAADLRRLSDDAEASLNVLQRANAGGTFRTDTELLRRLTAPFRRTALFSASGNTPAGLPPLTALERDYAQLKSEIAKASDANAATRGNSLFAALLWSQATSVALLTLLSATLFALAWFLRDRMVDPLENLRRSVAGAARGNLALPIWGTARDDEIGAIARAAEMLRQTAAAAKANSIESQQLNRTMERLTRSAVKLEAELAQIAAVASHARARIEDAGLRAAKASQHAAEAANLACEGTARMTAKTERLAQTANDNAHKAAVSLAETLARLSGIAAFIERGTAATKKSASPPAAADQKTREIDAADVLEDLIENLEALEYYAQSRRAIAGEDAILMNAALLDAIGRLNAVAGTVSAAAKPQAARPS